MPEADAEIYNKLVETKINPALLPMIDKDKYKNNDLILLEI